MTTGDRLGLAVRAFFLATVLVLALAFGGPMVVQGTLFLAVLAAVSMVAGRFTTLPLWWLCLVEGFFAALVVGVTLPEGVLLLPYLMVPVLLAGTAARVFAVVVVAGFEMLGLLLVLVVGVTRTQAQETIELSAPWAVASLGAGLMAVWVTQLRGGPAAADDAAYESARRLLSQLRVVARRLSSGLDPISMAGQILANTHEALDDTRSGLFVRTEGGLLAPLAYHGQQDILINPDEGNLAEECWALMRPVFSVRPSGQSASRHRTVLPLRSGHRLIGVVVSDAAGPPRPDELDDLMYSLDDQTLRLDTAMVFDEVRSLAMVEERQRLAREIHDGVAQQIAGLGYAVDDLAATAATQAQRASLQSLRGEITRVVSELRLSIFDLRSQVTPSAGLGSALSEYVRTVGARSGLTVHLTLDEAPTRLRSEVETELLRIVQEAVTNARKHSGAANLWVDCQVRPPFARISVQDDGAGLRQGRLDSYGLKIMQERADRINASLEIGPAEASSRPPGTRVAVTVGAAPGPGLPLSAPEQLSRAEGVTR